MTPRSNLADRFVGPIVQHGARTRAKRILQEALEEVRRRIRSAATSAQILKGAVEATRPHGWIRKERVDGRIYELTMTLSQAQATSIAIRAILEAARSQQGRSMKRRLARSLLAAYRGEVDPFRRWLEYSL